MRLLIVKNGTTEGPGLFEEILRERRLAYEVVDLDRGEAFPALEGYAALVVLGGVDSANDPTPKMHTELSRIRACLATDTPFFGICLGMQALVRAAGGRVVKSPVREVGIRDPDGQLFDVALTPEGTQDPVLAHLGERFPVFQLHGETVELPDGVTLLGTGRFCRHQIVRVGRTAYGFQCHVELTPAMFASWIETDGDLAWMPCEGLLRDFAAVRDEYARVGRQIFGNFLRLIA